MKSTPLSRALSAGALGLGLLTAVTSPSYAAPAADGPRPAATRPATAPGPASEAAAVELMRRQKPLLDAAHQLRETGAASLAGFSGITVDPERSTLRLYWDGGTPPASVQRTVQRLSRPSVRVEVRRAPAPAPGKAPAASVADGSPGGPVVDPGAGTADPAPRPVGRVNDRSPVSGGALIITQAETCTTGFGVVGAATGRKQLLTAGHCGAVGSPWFNGDGEFLGNASARHPEADALLIDVNSSDKVWHGAVTENLDGIDDKARTVTGARTPEVGQYLCTSGALSGTHCGLRVTRTGVVLSIGGRTCPTRSRPSRWRTRRPPATATAADRSTRPPRAAARSRRTA